MGAKLHYGKLDLQRVKAAHGKFNKTLHKQMILLMKGAIREFAKVAAENIHVDTGMAGGSLQPVAKEVGGGVLGIIRSRIRRSERTGYTTLTGRYYRSRKRNIEEGIARGEKAFNINFGTVQRPRMFFRFDIKVYQWARWEDDWGVIQLALAAMVRYINENFSKRFPQAEMMEALYPKPSGS